MAVAPLLSGQASAQISSTPSIATILNCRSIVEMQARLSCFDSASGALADDIESGNVVIVRRDRLQEAQRSTFGMPEAAAAAAVVSAAQVKAPPSAAGVAAPSGPSAILPPTGLAKVDTVSQTINAVSRQGLDLYVITLDDGSVWRTTEAVASFAPQAGETLTIRRAALGSYLAETSRSRPVRVKRVS